MAHGRAPNFQNLKVKNDTFSKNWWDFPTFFCEFAFHFLLFLPARARAHAGSILVFAVMRFSVGNYYENDALRPDKN